MFRRGANKIGDLRAGWESDGSLYRNLSVVARSRSLTEARRIVPVEDIKFDPLRISPDHKNLYPWSEGANEISDWYKALATVVNAIGPEGSCPRYKFDSISGGTKENVLGEIYKYIRAEPYNKKNFDIMSCFVKMILEDRNYIVEETKDIRGEIFESGLIPYKKFLSASLNKILDSEFNSPLNLGSKERPFELLYHSAFGNDMGTKNRSVAEPSRRQLGDPGTREYMEIDEIYRSYILNAGMVGMRAVNAMMNFTPTFQYTYAFLVDVRTEKDVEENATHKFKFSDNVAARRVKEKRDGEYVYMPIIITEKIQGITVRDYINMEGDGGRLFTAVGMRRLNDVILQVLLALASARNKIGFAHNTLDIDKVYVQYLGGAYTVPFDVGVEKGKEVYGVQTDVLARITDFRFAQATLGFNGAGKIERGFAEKTLRGQNIRDIINKLYPVQIKLEKNPAGIEVPTQVVNRKNIRFGPVISRTQKKSFINSNISPVAPAFLPDIMEFLHQLGLLLEIRREKLTDKSEYPNIAIMWMNPVLMKKSTGVFNFGSDKAPPVTIHFERDSDIVDNILNEKIASTIDPADPASTGVNQWFPAQDVDVTPMSFVLSALRTMIGERYTPMVVRLSGEFSDQENIFNTKFSCGVAGEKNAPACGTGPFKAGADGNTANAPTVLTAMPGSNAAGSKPQFRQTLAVGTQRPGTAGGYGGTAASGTLTQSGAATQAQRAPMQAGVRAMPLGQPFQRNLNLGIPLPIGGLRQSSV
jgi:hypothetical protein